MDSGKSGLACGKLGADQRGGAARGKKSEKGLDGAFPYHQKFYQLVKVLPFGQSIFMPSNVNSPLPADSYKYASISRQNSL